MDFDPTIHPAYARIDLAAIRHNVGVLRARAGSAALMAVVKADAYGHGLVPVARAAVAGGADWLGTAQLEEALQLRAACLKVPLLTWLHAPGADYAPAVAADIDLGVSAPWGLAEVVRAAAATGRTARVQLKVDTGLARNGAYALGGGRTDYADLVDRAAAAQAEGSVEVVGVFTHFAYADAPTHPSVRSQQEAFADAVALAERAGLALQVRHMSNSAATLTTPDAAWDMVRPGLAVYGLSPVPDLGSSADFDLVPAMTAVARVATLKRVPAGQGVSYGHTFTTTAPTTLADVPVGYADGIPRHVSNAASVWLGGAQRPIAGRVCMDQIVIDAGDAEVACGDEVVLFGPGTGGEPTAQDWAEAAGTINYEIVTRFGPRVPRVYVGGEGSGE
ncbi:MAG: alanine racemase [Actinobacteria bacterium]|nr:alanine racemase [Actinomycetota bacterium]